MELGRAASAARFSHPGGGHIRRGELGAALAIAALALAGGAAAVASAQTAVALALLVLLIAVHGRSRTVGMMMLWTYWLGVPALRRALDLVVDAPSADPLSLLPIVGTAALALLELRSAQLTPAAVRLIAAAAAGLVLGVPMGLLADPLAFAFGAAAYGAGLLAFVLGWVEARDTREPTLGRTLMVAGVPLALYGITQYFMPLTSWDQNWVDSADLGSIGAPQEGHIRVFSTLNSPGTAAAVFALAILFALALRARPLTRAVALIPLPVALGLTFVRSIWLSLVIGLLVYAAAARGKAAGRVVGVVAVVLVAVVVVGGSHPTTRAFTERVTSLGDPSSDVSAQERLQFTNELLPTALQQPLGAGLGQAGLALRLQEESDSDLLTATDNGYLALLYQVGPAGFLLVMAAIAACVAAAARTVRRSQGDRSQHAVILAALVMLLVAQASGDILFGITGAVFWYLAGLAYAGSADLTDPEHGRVTASAMS